jgi:hypothetical protein
MTTDADLLVFLLAISHHRHVRDLPELCVPDLARDRFGALVDLATQSSVRDRCPDRFGVADVTVGDRKHDRLHRREPQR